MKIGSSLIRPWVAVLFAVAASCLMVSAKTQETQTQQIERTDRRLPKSVRPLLYTLELDLSHAFDGLKAPATFAGSLTIDVAFFAKRRRSGIEVGATRLFDKYIGGCVGKEAYCESPFAGEPDEIVMHADESVQIDSVEVLKEGGHALKIARIGRDKQNQLLVLTMQKDLPREGARGQLRFNFTAPIRADNHGVYFSTDTSNGHNFRHVVAKFQPTFARLAMPCFDEPSFKAVFDLKLKHSASVTAYANTELEERLPVEGEAGVVESVFDLTPRMPIHMVAFVVGDFDPKPLTVQAREGLTLRFLSVPGSAQKGVYALEVARKALAWFEQYVDNKYPLSKLDVVAISDTDTDNTECWGLVFVRDFLAKHDSETLPFSRVTTAVNVAHVVVHQWFANLVTAEWWDDLWITESVAAQMSFEFVLELYADYASEYLVRIDTLSAVLAADESAKLHSLSPPADKFSTSAEIYQIFDQLTFFKSGTLARSIQNQVGHDQFRSALRLVVAKYGHKNLNYNEFMECIERTADSDQNIRGLDRQLRSFSSLPGFPLLNVDIDDVLGEDKLIVYAEPYDKAQPEVDTKVLYTHEFDDQSQEYGWSMPLEALFSDGADKHEILPAKFGDSNVALADLPDWFDRHKHYVKVQPKPDFSTYYRVRYSDGLLQPLRNPIEQKQLTPMDRIHILDDTRALVKSQLFSKSTFSELFKWYANEDSQPVVLEMLKAAQIIDESFSTNLAALNRLFDMHGFQVSGDESILEQHLRSLVLKTLISQNEQQVINEALKTFEAGEVALFLREPVYAAVVKSGSKDQVEQLSHHMEETDSYEERLRLASALALSQDQEVLNKLVRFLNERSGFKKAALQTLVQSQPRLIIDHGIVVVKQ